MDATKLMASVALVLALVLIQNVLIDILILGKWPCPYNDEIPGLGPIS